ncbi:MAG: diguanylate cyclase [Acidimicrobiia bacterium]
MRFGGAGPGLAVWPRIVVVAGALGALVVVLLAGGTVPWSQVPAPVTVDVVWLAALFAIADLLVLSLQDRWQVSSVSLSQIPLVIGLYFVAPPGLLLARVVGIVLALLVHRHLLRPTSPIRVLGALAAATVAVAVFRAVLGDTSAITAHGWLAAGAAVLAADALSAAVRRHCAAVDDRRAHVGSWWAAGIGVAASLAGTSLALLTVVVAWRDPAAALLLVVIAAVLFFAYHAYASLRQRYQGLAVVADFTGQVARTLEVDSVVDVVLREARAATGAARAEVVLLGRRAGEGLLRVVGDDTGAEAIAAKSVDPADLVWALAVARDSAFVLTSSNHESRLGAHLAERGIHNGIVAPLHGDEGISGMLLVANRAEGARPFDADDVRLLETLAAHASVSLENGRLIDALRRDAAEKEHQSLHDPLTGLANRVQFVTEIDAALDRRADAATIGVLLLDLDEFKAINDTYGHHDGDDALRQVAARLRGAVRPDDVIARLGGDEFAVLLRQVPDEDAAVERAWRSTRRFVHR